ncbi:mast cell protease 1A isoform X2 [Kryptolebias marmoratus]|uniref:trypsin n=1 Tax=Kryptolebias marmoratus TaxID=37003 RepID=A0A3Q2ZR22_KRYMA|nr:mast cell protease 1A isoform X2 [Kryptolebias marmoratus]
MFIRYNLAVLMLVLTFNGHAHTGKIIGGHEAKPHSRPYMVLLEMKTYRNETKHCGGFLLSEDFVMTAAHCQAKSYQVFLGLHSYNDQNKLVLTVKQAFPHKGYCKHSYINDIMLLKLSTKATFSDRVKPIALADQLDCSVPKSCIVAGWGLMSRDNAMMSKRLMEVNVTLIDDKKCPAKNMYCSEGEQGPFKGDSGGPLVCENGRAYGVVAAITRQSSGSMLYMYTKIPDSRKWLKYIMGQI